MRGHILRNLHLDYHDDYDDGDDDDGDSSLSCPVCRCSGCVETARVWSRESLEN